MYSFSVLYINFRICLHKTFIKLCHDTRHDDYYDYKRWDMYTLCIVSGNTSVHIYFNISRSSSKWSEVWGEYYLVKRNSVSIYYIPGIFVTIFLYPRSTTYVTPTHKNAFDYKTKMVIMHLIFFGDAGARCTVLYQVSSFWWWYHYLVHIFVEKLRE